MPVEGASLTQLIPLNEMAPGAAGTIRNQVIEALLAQAENELRIPRARLVVRDIRPRADLDYTPESWAEVTGSTIAAYETMSTGTMADQRYVAIFGVRDDSPMKAVSLIRFNIGGSDRAIWNLEYLGEEDESKVGFSPSAIVITPNAPYTLSRWVLYASVGAHIILKGVVVEPRGKVISP